LTRINLKKQGNEIIITIGISTFAKIKVLELLRFISEESIKETTFYGDLPISEKSGDSIS
jgi:hypothetical protein